MKQYSSASGAMFWLHGVDKRLVIAGLILGLIATAFWSGSRYPALNEKAGLGGDNSVIGIAFDQVISISAADTPLQRIVGNTLNWGYTNRQGMAFGLLFAASFMTLLKLFGRKQFKGRLANTVLGVLLGVPLGVCVNCAVPIAMGTQRAGARTETTLAMMFSSPTLNIVVLGMTIALFPFWLATLKVAATLLFIVVAVPLSVHWLAPLQAPSSAALDDIADLTKLPAKMQAAAAKLPGIHFPGAWPKACIWVAGEMLRNLWFIVRTTLPFMVLAAVLGAVAVTLLPWELLASSLPQGQAARFALLLAVALMGTFLPVPIAFDVVICSILLTVGVEARYVAALLVTLGLFSIYPALQIGRSISARLSLGLFLLITAFGVAVGLAGEALAAREAERQNHAINQGLMIAPQGPSVQSHPTPGLAATEILRMLTPYRTSPGVQLTHPRVRIQVIPFQPPRGTGTRLFDAHYGHTMGINEPDNISTLRFLEPLAENRSIASGDVHGDGWPDLLLTSEAGLALYANLGGLKFVRQEIRAPELDGAYVIRAALVDLDGDGMLDIVAGTFNKGVFFIRNTGGRFESGASQLPGHRKGAVTGVLAFGDLDRDGDLDIVVGNRAIGNNPLNRTVAAAQNQFLMREGEVLVSHPLPGPEGETLSILLSDLNNDGWLDIFVGNDYLPPDHLLLSDGMGSFNPIERELIGGTARWTMSLASADINGDLIPEVYAGNISGRGEAPPRDADQECKFETGIEKSDCLSRLAELAPFLASRLQGDAIACDSVSDAELREGCIVVALTTALMRRGGTGVDAVGDLCERIPLQWAYFGMLCKTRRAESVVPVSISEAQQTLDSLKILNVLLVRNLGEMRYTDQAASMGIDNGGWTWNARFADLDLDGRQDLYVVNGHTMARKRYEHRLFLNRGDRFESVAAEAGIASALAATSYTYFDFDRDGDLDIVTVPVIGPLRIFINNAAGGDHYAIEFELRDPSKNSHAIGAVITIHYGPSGSHAQMREIQLSGGFASFDEPLVHFGLGEYEDVQSIAIRWPNGEETSISGHFQAGNRYRILRSPMLNEPLVNLAAGLVSGACLDQIATGCKLDSEVSW